MVVEGRRREGVCSTMTCLPSRTVVGFWGTGVEVGLGGGWGENLWKGGYRTVLVLVHSFRVEL